MTLALVTFLRLSAASFLLTFYVQIPFTLQDLLSLLRSYKARGYYIVGLEQTSSSRPLNGFSFPRQPILLLLGKEKEGIPVEFLQAVDQCIEIPQLGIIRSMNVHVSGAVAIWEYTKQQIESAVTEEPDC